MKILHTITEIKTDNPSCDYYGFPENILTFGYSKKNSKLALLNLQNSKWYLRMEKTQAILIFCEGEMNDYAEGIIKLKRANISRFGVLNTFKKPPNPIKVKTWMSHQPWSTNDNVSNGTKHNVRCYMKRFQYLPSDKNDTKELIEILDNWYNAVQDRHFMTVYGHYNTVIKKHPQLENSHIIKMYPNGSDKPCGMIGGYIHDGQAVLVLAKHDYTQKGAGDALWGKWFEYVHQHCDICNNGDTSDKLKKKFGLTPMITYKQKRVKL